MSRNCDEYEMTQQQAQVKSEIEKHLVATKEKRTKENTRWTDDQLIDNLRSWFPHGHPELPGCDSETDATPLRQEPRLRCWWLPSWELRASVSDPRTLPEAQTQ